MKLVHTLLLAVALGLPSGLLAADAADELPGTWLALTAKHEAITAEIETEELGAVHDQVDQLVDLAWDLVGGSKSFDSKRRRRVRGAVKQFERAAEAVQDAADSGDLRETRKELEKLDSFLKLLEAQFPGDALQPAKDASGTEDAPGDAGS
jgi:hypothetical protein